jgi:hypothetical protein
MSSFSRVVASRPARSFFALLAAGCGLLLAVAPATAAAASGPVTIGASLSQAPNVSFGCNVIPFEFSAPAAGGLSCTWGSPLFSASNVSAGGLDVPGTGTVYQVKLRVGASTGPMQLAVLRTLFDPTDIVNNHCCVVQALSSVFTPVVNGITTLNVDLPVGEDDSPTASTDFLDQIGLSILEDGVTIPLIDETSLPINQQPVDNYDEPAMTLGESQGAADPDGYELDMQATWYAPGQSPATVVLPAQTVSVRGNNAVVGVDCSLAPCAGTVSVQGAPVAGKANATAARKSKTVTYASGTFNLAAGKSGSIPAKLTSQGRTLAHKHRRIKVTITVKLTNLSPAKTFSRTLTLRF